VLLRVFRGTGTSGLSGIHPRVLVGPKGPEWKGIIRPFLSTRRPDVEAYLQETGQPWRTDSTNSETTFTRNRLRHDFLPQIAKAFNPELIASLANLAEIARAEDEFWSAETAEAFVLVHRNQRLAIPDLMRLRLALRRRVLRLAAIQAGARLDFHHSERILDQLGKPHSQIELPHGFCALIESGTLRFEVTQPQAKPCGYSYSLPIPGQVEVPELGILVSTLVATEPEEFSRYNDPPRLALDRLPPELVLRNWRPGPSIRARPRK
jgi:tRNA(Ile)-lysidine synthase